MATTLTQGTTVVAQFTVPGTTAVITVEKFSDNRFYATVEAPHGLGGYHSCGRSTEAEAREAANDFWKHVVELRKRAEAQRMEVQQVPGLPGVTYGDVAATFSDTGAEPHGYTTEDYRRDANLAAATGTRNPRYAGVREARTEAKKVLAALAPDHSTFRVAVQLSADDKLRFFQLDTPLKGRWVGCVFMKEQAGDDLHKVRDIVREEAVLRAVIADAEGALVRYGLELGACGMCGRTLTDEESRARGIGPICAEKL